MTRFLSALFLVLCSMHSAFGSQGDGFVLEFTVLEIPIEQTLAKIEKVRKLGARHVNIPVLFCQDNAKSNEVHWCKADAVAQQRRTLTDLVRALKHRGMTVGIFPFLLAGDGSWRGVFEPADFKAWSASYWSRLLEVLEMIQPLRVSDFVVGSELNRLFIASNPAAQTFKTKFWRSALAQIRNRLKGTSVFIVANWDQWDKIPFWDASDYIGLSAYYPLSSSDDADTSIDELTRQWRSLAEKLTALSERLGRPLYFGEVGYSSKKSAAHEPWGITAAAELDLDLQARLFTAFGNVWASTSGDDLRYSRSLARFLVWALTTVDKPMEDVGFTVVGKPAELALAGVFEQRKLVSPEIFEQLIEFHPSWVTRSVTSHDSSGGNADGNGNGLPSEHVDGAEYHVLFHAKGEGRINRFWMTTGEDKLAANYLELLIQVDGKTVYRGKPLDFFEGRSVWKSPLVMSWKEASGAYLSYVPFPYEHEAKILFRGDPNYYQVTYREGVGASIGPSASELAKFLTENWWHSPQHPTAVEAKEGDLILAHGPVTVKKVWLECDPKDWNKLWVRVGNQDPVPATFFFGLGQTDTKSAPWSNVSSSLNRIDVENQVMATRLPIPLQNGELLTLVAEVPVSVKYYVERGAQPAPGVHLETQYRDQWAPGTETTMSFYESIKPTTFLSLIEEISDGKPGKRDYLEGDEMIRTDQMAYPLQLGTGTEDYFNGGWYFLSEHSNPLSGQPRFTVNDPEDGWSHAIFEHSLYRHHIADPIIGRTGMRFGFEAGETGSANPVRYRTLGLAYRFDGFKALTPPRSLSVQDLKHAALSGGDVVSKPDAERAQEPVPFFVRRSERVASQWNIQCPSEQAKGMFLVRSYDAAASGQEAVVELNGNKVGVFFESYANPERRFAQDALWIPLNSADCRAPLQLNIRPSSSTWTDAGYQVSFFVY